VNTGLFHQVLRVGQLPVIEVHVALRRRDIRVPQQAAGVFDPLLPADLRPAFVPGQVQDQVFRQPGLIPQPGIRPAEIRDGPLPPRRRQEDGALRASPEPMQVLVAGAFLLGFG
jgi:hypothetical protein